MDDQSIIDTRQGARLKRAIMETNQDRPPVNLRAGILYAPDDPEFWRQVAQRLRLDASQEGS